MEINLIKLKKNLKSITSVTLLVALVLLPVITLIVGSINLDTSNFKYLWDYLLIDYSFDTIYLLFLTLLFSLLLGILPAWFISVNKFRGRKIYDLLLYLPLAIPTYIMSFSYAEILSFSGPFQNLVRDYFPNFSDIVNRDYLQIEVLALLLSFSLFPYLYAACRISFSMIGNNYINLSKNLGLNEIKTFFRVGIPLSRPSIFSAIFLISMEVLNEYGAVSYFGVNTYTSGIFRAWGSLADINTASLLSVFLFFVVFVFFLTEKFFTNKYNSLKVIKTSIRNLFKNPVSVEELSGIDGAVVNPPRSGASAQCKELAKSSIPTIVLVSCNPTTFARDAEILVKGFYVVDWVRVIDQFRWSHHVEVIGKFSRRS